MQLHRPFRVITPTVDGDVLAALARADSAFTGRGLHRVIGRHSVDGVRKSLDRLAEQGIVDVEDVGPAKSYRLNRDHLVAEHIVAIATSFESLVDRLRNRLTKWRIAPAYAAIFGSAVRDDMRPDSDIDLFIVRKDAVEEDDTRWSAQLHRLSRDASRWTGNDVRVLEVSSTEARRGVRAKKQVYVDIQREGVRLLGPETYLRSISLRRAQ